MKHREEEIRNICERYGLKLNGSYFNGQLTKIELVKGKRFGKSGEIGERAYVDYMMDICLSVSLQVSKRETMRSIDGAKEEKVPHWIRGGILFNYSEGETLKAYYGWHSDFPKMLWARYKNKENFEGIVSLQDLKKCSLKERFNEAAARKFLCDQVGKRLEEIASELNNKRDYKALTAEIEDVIKTEYRANQVK